MTNQTRKKFSSALSPECPLCPINSPKQAQRQRYHQDKHRTYWRCSQCQLVFVPRENHLNTTQQKAIYDQHNNVFEDMGYQRFLNRLITALTPKLSADAVGLDFGCGPGPVLAQMLREEGYKMDTYDPIYAPETLLTPLHYDFVTATEVIEHFATPAEDLTLLWQCLKPGGWLGLMTKLVTDQTAFAQWHYIRDPTHVSFFSIETFNWLAEHWHTKTHFEGKDVILIQKP